MRIGCLFGTFDPPHYGHTAIAAYMKEETALEAIWLVVTPQNPFKQDQGLSPDAVRLAMVRAAVEDLEGVEACDVEMDLPIPNYTVDTLKVMRERWPEHTFVLLIGSDNLAALDRWKDPDAILEHHAILVYPRPGVELHFEEAVHADHPNIAVVDAPFLTLSSTRVREMIGDKEDVSGMVDPKVLAIVREQGLYTE